MQTNLPCQVQGDNTITVCTPFDKLAKGSALIIGDGVVQIKAEGVKASEKTMRFQLDSPVRDAAPRNSPVYLSKISPPPFRTAPIVIPGLGDQGASVTSMEEYVRSNRARSARFSIVSLT